MKRLLHCLIVITAALLSTGSAQAHHSFAMFDSKTQIVKTGTVVRFSFNNPHSQIYINIKNEDGSETLWGFEGGGPTGLIQRGVTGDAIKPGAVIKFIYCPLRDGRSGGAIAWVKLEDGKALNLADGGCVATEANLKLL